MNKREMTDLAKQARRFGHYDTGRTLWFECPQCRERVVCDKVSTYRMSVTKQLDQSMMSHLADYCGQD